MTVADLEVPQAAVEAAGLALGKALAAATYLDAGEEMVDWGQWHPCGPCYAPTSGKCGCAGAPFAKPDLTQPTLAAAAPHIAAAALRQAAEEHRPVVSPGAIGIGVEPDIPPGAIRCSLCGCPYPCPPYVRLRERANDLVPPTPDTREGILAAAGLTEEDMQERPVRVIENFRLESYGPDPYGMGAVISVTREAGEEQAYA